jgi:hypothetical protein
LRGVTHVATPRTARRRRSRRTPSAEAQQEQGGAAFEPAAAASGDASESSADEADVEPAAGTVERAPQDDGEAPTDADAAEAAKPGVTRPLACADASGEDGAAALGERVTAEDASCSAAAVAVHLPPVSDVTRLDAANWMGQLVAALWHLPLHKIRMPGTHDSGACRRALRRTSRLSPRQT